MACCVSGTASRSYTVSQINSLKGSWEVYVRFSKPSYVHHDEYYIYCYIFFNCKFSYLLSIVNLKKCLKNGDNILVTFSKTSFLNNIYYQMTPMMKCETSITKTMLKSRQ